MNALNIADIGLTPTVTLPSSEPSDTASDEKVLPEMRLVPGSVLAQAVYHMWKGTECVIVKSPPGGGKSTLVANIADFLRRNVNEMVTIITPTNAAATAIGKRMVASFGNDVVSAMSSGVTDLPMTGVNVTASDGGGVVGIATVASAVHSKPTGIVIVDEARQWTVPRRCCWSETPARSALSSPSTPACSTTVTSAPTLRPRLCSSGTPTPSSSA
jgi:hypothetical protein